MLPEVSLGGAEKAEPKIKTEQDNLQEQNAVKGQHKAGFTGFMVRADKIHSQNSAERAACQRQKQQNAFGHARALGTCNHFVITVCQQRDYRDRNEPRNDKIPLQKPPDCQTCGKC